MCVSIGGLEQLGTGAWRGNGEKPSPVAKDAGEGGYVSSTSPSDLISTSGNIQKIESRAFYRKLISCMLTRGV